MATRKQLRYERTIGASGPGVTAGVKVDFSRIASTIGKLRGANLSGAARLALSLTLDEIVSDLQVNKLSGSPAPVSSKGPIPRGGHYLAVRTGRGRASIASTIEESGNKLTGAFGPREGGPPGVYIRAHERGYRGTALVRAHERRTKDGTASVRAHYRFMDIRARRFIRAALLEGKPKLQRNVLVVLEALFGGAATGRGVIRGGGSGLAVAAAADI